MKIIFFGSSDFSLPFLKYFEGNKKHQIVGVVTMPAAPKGRGLTVTPNIIEKYATKASFPLFTPDSLNNESFVESLKKASPDLLVIASYGKFIPKKIRELTPYPMNIHPSLLPRHRGPNPILAPILEGDNETGVTVMKTIKEMDAGDIALQRAFKLTAGMTGGELIEKLEKDGLKLLGEFLEQLENGKVQFRPQDESKATCTHKTQKRDTEFSWSDDIVSIDRKIRAYSPKPRAYFLLRNKKIFVEKGNIFTLSDQSKMVEGAIIREADRGQGSVMLGLSYGDYCLERVAPEGKKPMRAYDFLQGYRLKVNDFLQ